MAGTESPRSQERGEARQLALDLESDLAALGLRTELLAEATASDPIGEPAQLRVDIDRLRTFVEHATTKVRHPMQWAESGPSTLEDTW